MAAPGTDLREGVASLTTIANRDLHALWQQVTTAVQAREALNDILPALIQTYGSAAATLAANWYDEQRRKHEATGRFEAVPAELGTTGAEALAGWGVAPLFSATPDWQAAQTLIAGGLQRRIANAARDTVTRSSVRDHSTVGWQRMGAGACAFCLMLIDRGAVYSEATADFASHDHCNCQAVPIFKGAEPIDVKPYVRSTRNITDADRARVRDYLRTH